MSNYESHWRQALHDYTLAATDADWAAMRTQLPNGKPRGGARPWGWVVILLLLVGAGTQVRWDRTAAPGSRRHLTIGSLPGPRSPDRAGPTVTVAAAPYRLHPARGGNDGYRAPRYGCPLHIDCTGGPAPDLRTAPAGPTAGSPPASAPLPPTEPAGCDREDADRGAAKTESLPPLRVLRSNGCIPPFVNEKIEACTAILYFLSTAC